MCGYEPARVERDLDDSLRAVMHRDFHMEAQYIGKFIEPYYDHNEREHYKSIPDFIIRPKDRLVDMGFPDCRMGVESKILNNASGTICDKDRIQLRKHLACWYPEVRYEAYGRYFRIPWVFFHIPFDQHVSVQSWGTLPKNIGMIRHYGDSYQIWNSMDGRNESLVLTANSLAYQIHQDMRTAFGYG